MRVLYTLSLSVFILLVSCSTGSNDDDRRHQITLTPVPEEAGTVSPASAEFEKNREVEISATPNQHWVFSRWEGDYEGTDNPAVFILDSDKEIAAIFVAKNYSLTIEIEGEGAVTERVIEQKTTEYTQGTLVELTAVPEENWEFVRWEGDFDGTDNPATITIDDEKHVTAVFATIEYPLTIHIDGEGRVDEEVIQAKTTDYPIGTEVQLTAIAEDNWAFSEWSGDLDGDENPATIIVDGPKEITATFLRTFTLTTVIEPNENAGIITPEAGDYVRDTSFDVEAIPNEGWEFVQWEGDFSGSVNPFSLTMNGNKTIVARFEPLAFLLETDIVGEGEVTVSLVSGSLTEDGYEFGSVVELTAIPENDWRFMRWEGDLEGDENPATLTIDGVKSVTAAFSFFEGGMGTEDDPYQITSLSQLNEARNHLNNHFMLMNNINASETSGQNGGLGFEPIGDDADPFTGSFDGGDFEISGLNINRSSEWYVGLFGYVDGGVIRNLNLTDVSVAGDERTGAIAGHNGGRIENSHISGLVSGDTHIGGLAGRNTGKIIASTSDANVNGTNSVGGLIGTNENEVIASHSSGMVNGLAFRTGGLIGVNSGLVYQSSSSADVEGAIMVGGLAGWNRINAEIRESFAEGFVIGDERVGGLVGRHDDGNPKIINSYALGDVDGADGIGGLVGTVSAGEISSSYSSGEVTGTEDHGGFAGRNSALIEKSYWDTENSGKNEGVGFGDDTGVTGLGTSDMTGDEAEANMPEFDWIEIWSVSAGYPVLRWQIE